MIITGEDLDDDADADSDQTLRSESKPVRILSDFSFYDPRNNLEMVPLPRVGEDHGFDQHIEAVGFVTPFVLNEEDDAQLDDSVADDQDRQYLRLSTIINLSIDYSKKDE